MEELVIEAGRAERQYWRDLWRYRELFYFLAWRDVLVRYKQTVIGIAWALLRPFLTMVVFTILFGVVAGMKSEGAAPYAIMVFAALLPWQFFSTALSESSSSLIGNANLISKVYFPRLIVPAGSILTSLVDFFISLGFLGVLMWWYQYAPSWRILFLPLFMLLVFAAALGPGLWLCALNVEYRDFRYIVPFLVQFGLFVSPVGFSSQSITANDRLPGWLTALYPWNPMVGVIDGFRWAILGSDESFDLRRLSISLGMIALLLGTGLWYFRKTEKTFADLI